MDRRDVVVVGAGAAGMMCAAQAGKRGRSVLILDHATVPGEKIRISGGGRCNYSDASGARQSGPVAWAPAFPDGSVGIFPFGCWPLFRSDFCA